MASGTTARPISHRAIRLAGLLVFAPTLAGCANKYDDLKNFVQAHNHDVIAATYRIEPPDVISVISPTAPEVHGVSQAVGADGKIELKLLGSVKVSRLTPKEAAAKIEDLLGRYYVEPKVEIRVRHYLSKKIYVFGQVTGTGPMPFTGRDTLLDILAQAKPTFIAWGAQVKVIRPSATPGEVKEIVVDVDKMIEEGDMRANFLLQEGDMVYVPPTPLGWVGLRVQEALFPFGPIFNAYTFPADAYTAPKAYDNLDDRPYSAGRGGGFGGNQNVTGW